MLENGTLRRTQQKRGPVQPSPSRNAKQSRLVCCFSGTRYGTRKLNCLYCCSQNRVALVRGTVKAHKVYSAPNLTVKPTVRIALSCLTRIFNTQKHARCILIILSKQWCGNSSQERASASPPPNCRTGLNRTCGWLLASMQVIYC